MCDVATAESDCVDVAETVQMLLADPNTNWGMSCMLLAVQEPVISGRLFYIGDALRSCVMK